MTNPYLRLVRGGEDDTAPAGIRNPYAEMLEANAKAEEQERARVLNNALKVSPDEEAELRQLHQRGQQSVMPSAPADSAIGRLQSAFPVPPSPDLIQDKTQFKLDLTMRELVNNTIFTPALRRKYTQEDFARIASDDSRQLSVVEHTLKQTSDFGRSFTAALPSTIGLSAAGLGEWLDSAVVAWRKNVIGNVPGVAGAVDKLEAQEAEFWAANPSLAQAVAGPGAALRAYGGLGKDIAATWRPDEMGIEDQIAEGLGQIITAVALTAATGSPVPATVSFAGIGAEQQAESLRAVGLAPSERFGELSAGAAITGGSELLRLGSIMKVLPPRVRDRVVGSVVARIGGQGLEEGAQEIAEGLAQNLVTLTYDPTATVFEGLAEQGGIAAATAAIFQTGVELLIPGRQRAPTPEQLAAQAALEGRSAEGQLARLQDTLDAAAQSKLVKRDRAALEEFVNEAAEGTELSNVFIAPDSFAQVAEELGVDVMELARQLGVADQVQDSALTSTPITMPVGKFIATVADTDLAGPLMEVAKLNPFLPSRAEIKAAQEAGEDQFVARAEALAAAVAQDETVRVEAEAISARIAGEMNAVGRFTGDANRVYATAATQMYVQLAQRLGISPQQAFDNYPLRVAGQRIGGQQVAGRQEGQVQRTVNLYRGVGEGRDPASATDVGRFLSPDRAVAETYAGPAGTIAEEQVTFNNLLETQTWMQAKERLGLPPSATMQDLVAAAQAQGYDGVSFTTKNGVEYIQVPVAPAEQVLASEQRVTERLAFFANKPEVLEAARAHSEKIGGNVDEDLSNPAFLERQYLEGLNRKKNELNEKAQDAAQAGDNATYEAFADQTDQVRQQIKEEEARQKQVTKLAQDGETLGQEARKVDTSVAGGLTEKSFIRTRDLEGATIFPMFADLTDAGSTFATLDGLPIAPTPYLGGPNFPWLKSYRDAGIVWAFNAPGVITKVRNKVRALQEQARAEGRSDRVVITMLAMKDDAHTSNEMVVSALLRTLDAVVEAGRFPQEQLAEAKELIVSKANKKDEGYSELATFPGFGDAQALHDWSRGATFAGRKALAKEMRSAKFQQLPGMFPVERIVREAIDPDYRATQQGDALLAFEIDPDAEDLIIDFENKDQAGDVPRHPAYRYGMRGTLVGSFSTHIPMEVLYADLLPAVVGRAAPSSNPKFLMERLKTSDAQVVTEDIVREAEVIEGLHDYRIAQAHTAGLAGQWRSSDVAANKGGVNPVEFERALVENEAAATLTKYTRTDVTKGKKDGSLRVFQLGEARVQDGGLNVWMAVKTGYDYRNEYPGEVTDALVEQGILTDNEVALVGVASNELGVKGMATFQVLKGIEEGVTVLDAFKVTSPSKPDGLLPTIYATLGFEEVGQIPFDPKYYNAQQLADLKAIWTRQGWNEADGYPAVAIMKWRGDDAIRPEATRRFILESQEGLGIGSTPDVAAIEASTESVRDSDGQSDQGDGLPGQGDGRADPRRFADRARGVSDTVRSYVENILAADARAIKALKLSQELIDRIRAEYGPALAAQPDETFGQPEIDGPPEQAPRSPYLNRRSMRPEAPAGPGEATQALREEWRPLMPSIAQARATAEDAIRLAEQARTPQQIEQAKAALGALRNQVSEMRAARGGAATPEDQRIDDILASLEPTNDPVFLGTQASAARQSLDRLGQSLGFEQAGPRGRQAIYDEALFDLRGDAPLNMNQAVKVVTEPTIAPDGTVLRKGVAEAVTGAELPISTGRAPPRTVLPRGADQPAEPRGPGRYAGGTEPGYQARGRRGEYSPRLKEIRLNASADFSTFLHELGHHFLEVYDATALTLRDKEAAGETLTEGERGVLDDTRRLLAELARQTNTEVEGDVLDWWRGRAFKDRVQMHEQFARLTEAYFLEGKAPTPELQTMFQTFKRWMLQVYSSLTELNVELNDEVRGILDRMVAAEADIRTAEQNRGLNAMFATKPEFMTDDEWYGYQQLALAATQAAEEELTARSLRDMQWLSRAKAREIRRLQKDAAEQRAIVEADVTAEVMSMPVNRARNFLKRGVNPDGTEVQGPHKLSIDLLKAAYPDGEWTALGYGRYGMLAKEGLDAEMVAELFGYDSGDAMIRALLNAEPAEATIEGETDRRMLEQYGDLINKEAINRAADEALHNAFRGRVLSAEYAALAKASGQRKMMAAAAQQIAKQAIGKLNAAKLNPRVYIAAERSAARKAEQALRRNDLVGAATAKRDQLLNFELAREAQRVLKQRNRTLDLFRQVTSAKRDTVSKTRNYDLVQVARAILAAHGMGQVRNAPIEYLDLLKRYDPRLYTSLEATLLVAMAKQKTIADLSVDEFLGLGDLIGQLWTLSREEKQIEIEGRKVELEQITTELTDRLATLGDTERGQIAEAATDTQKALRSFVGLLASLRRVESWARGMDGGVVGPFTKYVFRPISAAADRYRADRNRLITQFRDLFRQIEPAMGGKKIAARELGYTFKNKAELLHAILHTGNASNKRKLLLGRQWGAERADGTLDDGSWQRFIARMAQEGTLTKADFDFVQGVWDLMEQTKPLAQATHRKVFGRYFAEITAEPVVTPFGTYAGGYVPAIYDQFFVADAAVRAQQEQVEANDSTMFPSPASGFTKSRVEYNEVLELNLQLLPMHIDRVLKFSHLASPVRDVLRILRDKETARALEQVDPTAQTDMLLPWLQRASRQIVEEPSKGQAGRLADQFFRGIRNRSGMGLMFANLVNVAQQFTGFPLALLQVKARYVGAALARYVANPARMTKAARGASLMMVERGDNQMSAMYNAIEQIIDKTNLYGRTVDWLGRHTYFMQQAVQNVMDVVVWTAAYDQALANGATEVEAAKQGDAVVRQTQGSVFSEDIARIETGPAWARTFTHMYSYFSMWGNLLGTEVQTTMREVGLRKGAGRLMFVYMMGFLAPAILAQLIADAMRGQLPEDEEDDGYLDEWLSWFFMTQAKTAIAFAPIVGQAANAAIGAFTDVPYDDRVGGSPAISAIEGAVRTPASVYDAVLAEGDKSRAVKDTLNLMTLLTGIPFQAAARPIGYAVDVAEGDIEPTDDIDYVRGLATGAASEASR